MNKILLMGLGFVFLATDFTSSPLLAINQIDSSQPTGGTHIEDAAMGYQLDIPPNWYVIVPPVSDNSITEFNSDLLEYYDNKNCKYIISPEVLKPESENRLWFISFNESRDCTGIIPTGLIMAAAGSFYGKIPMSPILKIIKESVPSELIDVTIQKTDNGITVGIIQIEPTDKEDRQTCPECIARYYLFTTEKGLVAIFIVAQKNSLSDIEPDLERVVSSIKYYNQEN